MKIEKQTSLVPKKLEESTKELTAKAEMALRNRYCKPEWYTFFEVAHSESGCRADCIAFSIFPSRSFKIIGFEIKSLRGDWQKELRNGKKADYFIGQCDEWYIVETTKGVVRKEELPQGWGLMTLQGSRLFTKVKSDVGFNAPPSREFFSRMIVQSHQQNVSDNVLWDAERRGRDQGYKDAMKTDWEKTELEKKAKLVDLMKEMGLQLWRYEKKEIERIQEVINILDSIGGWDINDRLKSIESYCEDIIETTKKHRESLYKIEGVKKGD